MIEIKALTPTSVAHVTSQRTISRRRQFNDAKVILITCEKNNKKHLHFLALLRDARTAETIVYT